MKAKQKSLRGKRKTNRLMRNGYSALSRFTLMLARTGLIDPFVSNRTILPRRTISVFSVLAPATKTIRLQLSLATANVNLERGAAQVQVSFFSLFGRKLSLESASCSHSFFADTIGSVVPQNAYFDVPTGAKWVSVQIKRNGASRRIGIHGSLRPKAFAGSEQASLEETLVGRDRKLLEAHLQTCQAAQDRQTALRVLERMIYLEKRESDETLHRMLADLSYVLQNLQGRVPTAGVKSTFNYGQPLIGAYSSKVPLSKWLSLETRGLSAAAQGACVHVSNSEQVGAMVLACLAAGLPFVVEDGNEHQLAAFNAWVFDSDFNEILAFNPEH